MPDEAPGAFGIDSLTREIKALRQDLLRAVSQLERAMATGDRAVESALARLSERLERIGSKTMATLDTLAGQVADLKGAAQAEAQEVKNKLDEMTALIQQLQQNANDPAKVDAISQDLDSLKGEIQSIFTGEPPPSPQPGRKK